MDHRFYFAAGDLLANLAVGSIVGLVCWAIVGPQWNHWVAMIVMMPIGMIAGLLLFFPLCLLLGAMEVMVPAMLSGMVSGMVVGMGVAMAGMSAGTAAGSGALCGFVSILFVWIMNALLRGASREAMNDG